MYVQAGIDYAIRSGEWVLYAEAAKHAHLIQKVT